jgi:hypothetical protein
MCLCANVIGNLCANADGYSCKSLNDASACSMYVSSYYNAGGYSNKPNFNNTQNYGAYDQGGRFTYGYGSM